jgi:DNA-binding NarL/FixJ family response regulator
MKKASFSIVLGDNQPLTAAGLLSFLSDHEEFKVVDHLLSRENPT